MSVSISYSPVKKKYLGSATSRIVEALTEVFVNPPWELGVADIDILAAMSAACSCSENPYSQLREAIVMGGEDFYVQAEY